MSIYSVKNARNFYITKSVASNPVSLGASTFKGIGAASSAPEVAFLQIGQGGPVRSDLIKVGTMSNIRVTKGSALKRPLKRSTISLKSDYVTNLTINTTALPVGTACITKITFFEYGAPSTEDQLSKIASATITTSMTTEQFYTNLKASLVANFANEPIPTLSFELDGVKAKKIMSTNSGITITANSVGTAGNSIKFAIDSITETWVENTIPGKVTVAVSGGITTITVGLQSTRKTIADLKAIIAAYPEVAALITITGTDATTVAVETAVTLAGGTTTGVIVQDIAQPFVVGKKYNYSLNYVIESTSSDIVYSSGPITIANLIWANVTAVTPTQHISATYDVADMEYFFLGERGDVYRNMGFPNNINIEYMTDMSKVYNLIDFDFYFTDGGLHPQQSTKHITIACEETSETTYTVTNALIGALNTASGLSIATLS